MGTLLKKMHRIDLRTQAKLKKYLLLPLKSKTSPLVTPPASQKQGGELGDGVNKAAAVQVSGWCMD